MLPVPLLLLAVDFVKGLFQEMVRHSDFFRCGVAGTDKGLCRLHLGIQYMFELLTDGQGKLSVDLMNFLFGILDQVVIVYDCHGVFGKLPEYFIGVAVPVFHEFDNFIFEGVLLKRRQYRAEPDIKPAHGGCIRVHGVPIKVDKPRVRECFQDAFDLGRETGILRKKCVSGIFA